MSLKPWLLVPPKIAHDLSPYALKVLSLFTSRKNTKWHPLCWRDLNFENPLSIAGGVDKNAEQMAAWNTLGCGFVEIGTVTPKPQTPNPGKIMDRSLSHQAVWNKMGFPSKGCDYVKSQLKKPQNHKLPMFINIGKNRDTVNQDAHNDYIYLMNELKDYTDVFVVNISSPNTKGLRDLLKEKNIEGFLKPIIDAKTKPIILKVSPDMQEDELYTVLDVSERLGVDGWTLTNTTLERPFGKFPPEGGLSGAPLKQKSLQVLKLACDHLGDRKKGKLMVAAGGIMSYDDAIERLEAGADLVQIYSGLIFEGPGLFQKINNEAQLHQ